MTPAKATELGAAVARLLRGRDTVANRRRDMTILQQHLLINEDLFAALRACELEINGHKEEAAEER